jgi:hypothetical protein
MRSEDKIEVYVRKMPEYGNKLWARIVDRKTRLEIVPSFEDVRRILLALWRCEERNYEPPQFLGGKYLRNMLDDDDFWNPEVAWEILAAKYKIPLRE